MGDRVLISFFDMQTEIELRMEGFSICDMDVTPWDETMMRCRNCGCVSKIPEISVEMETPDVYLKGDLNNLISDYPIWRPQICNKCKSAIRRIYGFK